MTRWLYVVMLLSIGACSGRKSDPPPPASSALVPAAAPNARGTMAAGSAPVPGLAAPVNPDDDEEPAPPLPPPPASDPVDSGVAL